MTKAQGNFDFSVHHPFNKYYYCIGSYSPASKAHLH